MAKIHQKFDPKAAAKLAAGEHILYAAAPGLRLVASEGARRSWIYRYRDPVPRMTKNRKLVHPTKQTKLGQWPAMDWQAALAAWAAASGQRAAGSDPAALRKAAKDEAAAKAQALHDAAEKTVGWLVEQYLTRVVEPHRKEKGAAETRRMLTRAIARYRGIPARDLTREQAHQMIEAVADTAPRVAAMSRQALRAAWEHGRDRGAVEANPFAGRTVGGVFKAKRRDRYLTDEEAGQLLHWWQEPGSMSRTVTDILTLTLYLGLRSGEVCGIHADELVERAGVLWLDIPASRMKGGKAHSVPLVNGTAKKIIEARRRAGGYLFPATNGDGPVAQKIAGVEVYATSGRSKAPVYRHRKVCPVKEWAPHDLRRTARTMLSKLGAPFEIGEAILAHEMPKVAATYTVVGPQDPRKAEWLRKLGKHLDRLAAAALQK